MQPFLENYVEGDPDQGPSEPWEPAILPARWTVQHMAGATGFAHRSGLRVICSVSKEKDGKEWLHVSVSQVGRLPSWDDMRNVKDIFVGTDKKAVIVLPPRKEYVNVNPYVLHLWHCLESDPLPDFRRAGIL